MKNKIKKIFTYITPWAVDNDLQAPKYNKTKEGNFVLKYKNKTIGTLEYKNNKWIFKYSDQFKNEQFIEPIIDFPNIDKVYESEELPPFFASRIPNLKQDFHLKKLEKYKGDKNDLVSLLKIFGKKSINNPFKLLSI